jgi:hypothetical protein
MTTTNSTDRLLKTPQSIARCRVGKKKCTKTNHNHSIDPSSTLLSPPPSRHNTTSLQHFTDDFLATPSKSYGSLQAAFQERGQRDATPALKLRSKKRRQALSLITINGRAQISSGLAGSGSADSDSSDDDDDYYYTPDDALFALKKAVTTKNSPDTMQPEDPSYLYDPPQTPPRNITSAFYDYQHVAATTPSKFVTDATLFSAYTVIGMSPYGF